MKDVIGSVSIFLLFMLLCIDGGIIAGLLKIVLILVVICLILLIGKIRNSKP